MLLTSEAGASLIEPPGIGSPLLRLGPMQIITMIARSRGPLATFPRRLAHSNLLFDDRDSDCEKTVFVDPDPHKLHYVERRSVVSRGLEGHHTTCHE